MNNFDDDLNDENNFSIYLSSELEKWFDDELRARIKEDLIDQEEENY